MDYTNGKATLVYVPRKLGRINPDHFEQDNFDFAKVVDTIGKVATTAQQVSGVAQGVKTLISKPKTVASVGSNAGYVPSYGYPGYVPPSNTDAQYKGLFDNSSKNITYIIGGVIALILIAVTLRKS